MKFEKDFALVYFKKREKKKMLIETIVGSLLIGVLVFFLSSDNPYSLREGGFPWMIIFPMFFALFFNTSYGLLSMAILLAIYGIKPVHISLDILSMQEYIVGGFTVVMLAGLFSAYWKRVVSHDEHLNEYLHKRMEDLSKDYYLLKISHERLEHAYITKPLSFRGAINLLKTELAGNPLIFSEETGLKMLTIFSQYCTISNAMLVIKEDPKVNMFSPLTSLGKPFTLDDKDTLIQQVVDEGTTNFVGVNQLDSKMQSNYLAVIPLLDDENNVFGLIIIKDMPFWLLNGENMTALSVFASVIMLHMPYPKKILGLFSQFPEIEHKFLQELYLLRKLKKYHEIDSVLAALIVPAGHYQDQIIYSLKQSVRSLDYMISIPHKENVFMIVLMPLTPESGAYGYESRLKEWIKHEFGLQLNENGLLFRYRMMDAAETYIQLQNLIEELSNECN